MVAYLVGTPEDVTYNNFQALMFQKEAERNKNGSFPGQQLVDVNFMGKKLHSK